MNSDYRNDRNSFRQRDEGSDKENRRLRSAGSRHGNYGRDYASMRGNDYYGTQSYTNDYSRGNYSASTFGAGGRSDLVQAWSNQVESPANQPENAGKTYIEFPDYSNRPTYSNYAGSRAYTNFIDHNYGSSSSGPDETGSKARYNSHPEESRDASRYDHKTETRGSSTRFKSANQARYSKNDGRRR